MQYIERGREGLEKLIDKHKYRSFLRETRDSKFWEEDRISSIFNPEIMSISNKLALRALVYGHYDDSRFFASLLWKHQFELTDEQVKIVDSFGKDTNNKELGYAGRLGAAIRQYQILADSPQVSKDFSILEAAKILEKFEGQRSMDAPLGRPDEMAGYIAATFSGIYEIRIQDVDPYANAFADAHIILPKMWEVKTDEEKLDLWSQVDKKIEFYYHGLHDLVADKRGERSWNTQLYDYYRRPSSF